MTLIDLLALRDHASAARLSSRRIHDGERESETRDCGKWCLIEDDVIKVAPSHGVLGTNTINYTNMTLSIIISTQQIKRQQTETFIRTCMRAYVHMYVYACMHVCMYAYVP